MRRLANASGVCADDFECPDNELCFAGVPWFEETEVLRRENPDGCVCNAWYGWVGPNCDEYSPATVGIIVWNMVSVLIGLVNCALLVICALEFNRSGKKKLCSLNTTSMTILFSFVSSINGAWWALGQTLSAGMTAGDPILPYEKSLDIYKGRWNFLSNFFAPIAVFLAALALLNISLMWVEVSVRSNRLTSHSKSRLFHMRRVVYVFQGMAIFLGTLGAIAEKSTGRVMMGYFISPLIICVIITYLLGAYKVHEILIATTSERDRYVLRHNTASTNSVATAPTPPEDNFFRSSHASAPPDSDDDDLGGDVEPIVTTDELMAGSFLDKTNTDDSAERGYAGAADRETGGSSGAGTGRTIGGAVPPPPNMTAAAASSPISRQNSSMGGTGKKLLKASLHSLKPTAISTSLYSTNMSIRTLGRPKRPEVMRNGPFMTALRRIRNTSVAVSAVLVLFLVSYLTLSIIDSNGQGGYKAVVRPATLSGVKMVHNLLISATVLSQTVVAAYIFKIVNKA